LDDFIASDDYLTDNCFSLPTYKEDNFFLLLITTGGLIDEVDFGGIEFFLLPIIRLEFSFWSKILLFLLPTALAYDFSFGIEVPLAFLLRLRGGTGYYFIELLD